jgi:hypothetical protein
MMMEGQEMDLGLGLGAPDAVRRIGRGVWFGESEFVILPVDWERGRWEVGGASRGGGEGDEGVGGG